MEHEYFNGPASHALEYLNPDWGYDTGILENTAPIRTIENRLEKE